MKNAGYFYRRKMRNVFKSVRLSACLVIIMTHVSLLLSQYSVAQEVTPPSSLLTPRITDVFKQMPDSLMPYLTANNRLDFNSYIHGRTVFKDDKASSTAHYYNFVYCIFAAPCSRKEFS